ncbi:MAG: hypothetical protein D6780_07445 [Candidatus Dadabacteria bacterium]|nr:MAG: hypothetical protein D6780_07445 [Candidatus Dadabacteria bacterium]
MESKDIILLEPSAKLEKELAPLLALEDFNFLRAKNVQEVLGLLSSKSYPILIPSKLLDNSNGIAACAQIRAEREIVPITAYLPHFDKAVFKTFYEVGANLVFSSPFNEAEIAFQMLALSQLVNKAASTTANLVFTKEKDVLAPLNFLTEGVVILNSSLTPVFFNRAFLNMIRAKEEVSEAEIRKCLASVINREDSTANLKAYQAEVVRLDGTTFRAQVNFIPFSAQGLEGSTAVIIVDLSGLQQLQSILLSAHRTKKVTLLALAGAFSFLSQNFKTPLLRTIQVLESLSQKQKKYAVVESVLTTLLDSIDLIVEPGVNVKVSCPSDTAVCVTPGHLMILLGHLILFSAEFAAPVGDVSVDVASPVPGEGVTILISSEPSSSTPYLPEDPIAKLVFHKSLTSNSDVHESQEDFQHWLKTILLDVQQIADLYRTKVEYKIKSSSIIMRIKLPPAWREPE